MNSTTHPTKPYRAGRTNRPNWDHQRRSDPTADSLMQLYRGLVASNRPVPEWLAGQVRRIQDARGLQHTGARIADECSVQIDEE